MPPQLKRNIQRPTAPESSSPTGAQTEAASDFAAADTTDGAPTWGEEDEFVNIGVNPAEAWSAPKPQLRRPVSQKLVFKQTIIPILLTLGVLLPGLVVLGFLSDAESPFYTFRNKLFVAASLGVAAIFLLLGLITMAQVRHLLHEVGRTRVNPGQSAA